MIWIWRIVSSIKELFLRYKLKCSIQSERKQVHALLCHLISLLWPFTTSHQCSFPDISFSNFLIPTTFTIRIIIFKVSYPTNCNFLLRPLQISRVKPLKRDCKQFTGTGCSWKLMSFPLGCVSWLTSITHHWLIHL